MPSGERHATTDGALEVDRRGGEIDDQRLPVAPITERLEVTQALVGERFLTGDGCGDGRRFRPQPVLDRLPHLPGRQLGALAVFQFPPCFDQRGFVVEEWREFAGLPFASGTRGSQNPGDVGGLDRSVGVAPRHAQRSRQYASNVSNVALYRRWSRISAVRQIGDTELIHVGCSLEDFPDLAPSLRYAREHGEWINDD